MLYRLVDDGDTVVDMLDAVAQLVEVPLTLSLHRLDLATLDPDSLLEGKRNPDAPLVPVADPLILAAAPEVTKGLVGDGVTPLLIQIKADPADLENLEGRVEFKLRLQLQPGGDLLGDSLQDRLRVLDDDEWVAADTITLTTDAPFTFAYLTPVLSDEIDLSATDTGQIVAGLQVLDAESSDTIEETTFFIRKPPVILVHGYNTTGDWGDEFTKIFHRSRPRNNTSFVIVGRYGQGAGKTAGIDASINTVASLRDLVAIASKEAFDDNFDPIKEHFAVTRHDVMAHSQGGVLTRMMSSEDKLTPFLPRPYQSDADFNRGRFHRIVTVGSPQNGTRTLHYMRALIEHQNIVSLAGSYPLAVAHLMTHASVAQNKFDPFDVQIRQINTVNGLWATDPDAKFHIIRTTVNDGEAPSVLHASASDYFLGLANVLGGPLVLPRGSDGVVDFDSMGCHGPGGSAAGNVFTITGANIAHAGPLSVLGGDDSQTASVLVAEHAIGALDQKLATSDQRFAVFPLPPLLPDTEKAKIDYWAATASFDLGGAIEILDGELLSRSSSTRHRTLSVTTLNVALAPLPNTTVTGDVNWVVEVYGRDGITYDTLHAVPHVSDPWRASVEVPNDLEGQVVVYANYATVDGLVLGTPLLIANRPPSGAALTSIAVQPDATEMAVNSVVAVNLLATYANGETRRVFVAPGTFSATSSQPARLDVSSVSIWKALAPGAVTVSGSYQGLNYTVQLTVVAEGISPEPTRLPADQTVASGGSLTLEANADGSGPLSYQWLVDDAPIAGATASHYALPSAQLFQAGKYSVTVTNAFGSFTSPVGSVAVIPPGPNNARLLNLSTRGLAEAGANQLFPGFVVSGTGTKRLLIRAVGPSLGDLGVPFAVLPDPRMELKRFNFTTQSYEDLETNDDWGTNANAAAITTTAAQLFAFPFTDARDAALLVDLPAGQYAVVGGDKDGTRAIGMVELYDADVGTPTATLINISNRGFCGVGDSVMIPGFVVSSEGPKTLLVRVVGPTLGSFGVPGTMTDPKLEIYPIGAATPILTNDNWGDNPDAATTVTIAQQVFAFPLTAGSADAAFVITLPPGGYTIVGSGADGSSTGVVLVEVYVVP